MNSIKDLRKECAMKMLATRGSLSSEVVDRLELIVKQSQESKAS